MVERLATISDGDDITLEGCYSMNDCYLQALSQAPCAHPQVYVSELPSAASVSLATHPHQPSNTTNIIGVVLFDAHSRGSCVLFRSRNLLGATTSYFRKLDMFR